MGSMWNLCLSSNCHLYTGPFQASARKPYSRYKTSMIIPVEFTLKFRPGSPWPFNQKRPSWVRSPLRWILCWCTVHRNIPKTHSTSNKFYLTVYKILVILSSLALCCAGVRGDRSWTERIVPCHREGVRARYQILPRWTGALISSYEMNLFNKVLLLTIYHVSKFDLTQFFYHLYGCCQVNVSVTVKQLAVKVEKKKRPKATGAIVKPKVTIPAVCWSLTPLPSICLPN